MFSTAIRREDWIPREILSVIRQEGWLWNRLLAWPVKEQMPAVWHLFFHPAFTTLYEFEPPYSRCSEITHKDAPQSVGLLLTSDQPVAETSTWQHTQHSQRTTIHAPGGIRTRNPSKRSVVDTRPRPLGHWDRQLGDICVNCYLIVRLCLEHFHFSCVTVVINPLQLLTEIMEKSLSYPEFSQIPFPLFHWNILVIEVHIRFTSKVWKHNGNRIWTWTSIFSGIGQQRNTDPSLPLLLLLFVAAETTDQNAWYVITK